MEQITYKKDGILIGGIFISLSDIIEKCNIEFIKDEKLILLKIQWTGWRGFDEGILEIIALPMEKIKIIKKHILGKTIYFGEIAGKHSDVYGTLDENDIELIHDPKMISDFLHRNPNRHNYNHSFLYRFHDYAIDGVYDDVSEVDVKEFSEAIN